jgi:hypothetical protein
MGLPYAAKVKGFKELGLIFACRQFNAQFHRA